jgi:hypothetical protein
MENAPSSCDRAKIGGADEFPAGLTVIVALGTAAPDVSVTTPVIVADRCAWVGKGSRKNSAKAKTKNARMAFWSLMVSLSPSRAGVEGCPHSRSAHRKRMRTRIETPPVSWLGGKTMCAAFPSPHHSRKCLKSESESADSDARYKLLRLTVARRRRIFTVFPCAESLVEVSGQASQASRTGAAMTNLKNLQSLPNSVAKL